MTAPASAFQVVQGDLINALADGILAAAPAKAMIPALAAVYIEGSAGDKYVTVTATDRLMLLSQRVATVEPLTEDVSALVPADQAKRVVAFHKSARGYELAISATPDYLAADGITVPLLTDAEFVKFRSLIPHENQLGKDISVLAIDLALMVRVSKMSAYHKGRGVRLRFTEGKEGLYGTPPRLIVVVFPDRDDVTLLVMPMRMPG
jgi:DNA polymerase III sliding clamp (beta) subunit (PCNA family)